MSKLKSYFEARNGDIIKLNEIRYCNVEQRSISMPGNIITFTLAEKEDFENCVAAFKEFRDQIDTLETLKLHKEIIIYAAFDEEVIKRRIEEIQKEL